MTRPLFSETEAEVLQVLGRKKMKVIDLTKELYQGGLMPFDANNKIAGVIRRIVAKCDHHKLNWTISSEGGGRAGKTVWKSYER